MEQYGLSVKHRQLHCTAHRAIIWWQLPMLSTQLRTDLGPNLQVLSYMLEAAQDTKPHILAALPSLSAVFAPCQQPQYIWELQEPDLEVLANMLEAVQDTVRLVGPALLTLDQLSQAFQRFKAILDDSAKRRKERSKYTSAEDFDEADAENLEVGNLGTTVVL